MKTTILILLILIYATKHVRLELLNVISEQCTEGEAGQCVPISAEMNENQNEEKETPNNWECPENEVENEQNLITLNDMIKKGEREIQGKNEIATDTILVLGNAGAGKTTFVQFMAGDNSKLVSKEVSVDSATFTIEDGYKIGNSVTESFTTYPEAIPFTENQSITDTPGFKDTRSINYEIIETFIMKNYLKNIKNIKIALIITYHSLQQGLYKDDFINLLKNLNTFFKDLNEYNQNIILIATKVPNTYRVVKGNFTLVSNEKIISGIAEFLKNVQQSLNDKLKNSHGGKESEFFQNVIKLIDSLLEKDENLNYKKINIFRQPSEPGALSDMPLFQTEKISLEKTINNINFKAILEDNVGYSLSDRALNYLHCLTWYVNEKVSKMSSHTFQLLKHHFELRIKNYTDVYLLSSELDEILSNLKSFKHDLKASKYYSAYSSTINKFINNENIQFDETENVFQNFDLDENVSNLQKFTSTSKILSTITWSEQIKNLINCIKENLSWYKFLIKTFEYSSSYKIQNMKSKYFSTNIPDEEQDNLIRIILTNADWLDKKSDSNFNILTLDDDRKTELNNIFSLTLKEHINITCDEKGKLIIQGYYIKFSDINSEEFMKKHCTNTNITAIGIYAIHTIFIDADFNNEYFRGIDLMVAAPKWEIIGNRIINIDGVIGKNHEAETAENGNYFGADGKDGLSGLPGGNGGNFFGIGLYFVNEHNIIISTNGGAGGPGQNGGNGEKGENGESGKQKFLNDELPNDNNYNAAWTEGMNGFPLVGQPEKKSLHFDYCTNQIFLYAKDGDCGKKGGLGGNGGVGGKGGFNGNVILFGEKESPKFIIKNSTGITGSQGKGGNGGKHGERGKSMSCFKLQMIYTYSGRYTDRWICTELIKEIKDCDDSINLNGLSNYSDAGIQEPTEKKAHDFSSDLYNYTRLLNINENNKYLVNLTTKFQSEIYKNLYTMKNLFWRFIFLQETSHISEQQTTEIYS